MATTTTTATNLELPVSHNPKIGWRESIERQLQLRKSIEQSPFEGIFNFATTMFDRVDIYKTENIQLNLKSENLRQEILKIQQTLLASGSAGAKTILPKLTAAALQPATEALISTATAVVGSSSSSSTTTTTNATTGTSTTATSTTTNSQQADSNAAEVIRLQNELKIMEDKYKTLEDEHTALSYAYKSLEKKHQNLLIECDNMRTKILADIREQADRINAENERVAAVKREQQQEAVIANMNNSPILRDRANTLSNPGSIGIISGGLKSANSIATDPTIENFDTLDDQDTSYFNENTPSKIPQELLFSFDGHDGDANAVNWYYLNGPRSSFLATGGEDRKVKIWSIGHDSSTLVATLQGSNKSITSIDVESEYILASSNDYATRLWYMSNYRPKQTLTGHSAKVTAAKFLDNPTKVASGSVDRTVKIWDVNLGACLKTYFVGSSCFDLVYKHNQLITCHQDSKLRFWNLTQINSHDPVAEIVLQARITSLDISKDGNYLLCSLRDNTIKVLDIRRMEVLKTFSDERFKIGLDYVRAKFSIDNQHICCGSNDGSVYIWNANSAKLEKVLRGHDHTVLASSWSPDGRRMVTVERGRKVSIWA